MHRMVLSPQRGVLLKIRVHADFKLQVLLTQNLATIIVGRIHAPKTVVWRRVWSVGGVPPLKEKKDFALKDAAL